MVGFTGAAAADGIGAFTERGPVEVEDARLGGPGERLDTSAPDFPEAVGKVTADIVSPSAGARESAVAWQALSWGERWSEPTLVPVGGEVVDCSNRICAWSNVWPKAVRDDNASVANEAASVVLQAHTWTAITDTDPRMIGEAKFLGCRGSRKP